MDETRPGPWRVYFCSDARRVLEFKRARPDLGEGHAEVRVISFDVIVAAFFPEQV